MNEKKRAIAIDFGTARTKVAYRARPGERTELVVFGHEHERHHTPSLFYLPDANGKVLFGDAAEEMLIENPEAPVIDVLKRHLRDKTVRKGGRSRAPEELITEMLRQIRSKAGEIAAFVGQLPEIVALTVPASWGPQERDLLERSAVAVGFETTTIVDEPVAAARAWLNETRNEESAVVVLDCGGGTVDWAYLVREGTRFSVVATCPPGSVPDLGGYDVDRGLLEFVRSAVEGDAGTSAAIDARQTRILAQLRRLKEDFSRGKDIRPVKVTDGMTVDIPAEVTARVIRERFVTPVVERFAPYLEQVKSTLNGKSLPPVLLVGGSARLPGLKEAIEALECKSLSWERADHAPVLGGAILAGERLGEIEDTEPLDGPEREAFAVRRGPNVKADLPDLLVFRHGDREWLPLMVVLPLGSFLMGSPDDETSRRKQEGPQHHVIFNHRVAIGKHAVTFFQYDYCCQVTGRALPPDEGWGRGSRPVINVTWIDAQAYCEWLSTQTGKPYRLPTEAEWEYACRSGSATPFTFQNKITPALINYNPESNRDYMIDGIYRGKTVAVSSLPSNAWGLQEMHGNVWEWVEDIWHDGYDGAPLDGTAWTDGERVNSVVARAVRGGSWMSPLASCRSASRERIPPSSAQCTLGFRVACPQP